MRSHSLKAEKSGKKGRSQPLKGVVDQTLFTENGKKGGFYTYDKIFLLSQKEVLTFLGDCKKTAVCHQANKQPDSWWLRTRGEGKGIQFVTINGEIDGGVIPPDMSTGIRPALWIDYSSK